MLSTTSPILFPIVVRNRNATLPSDTHTFFARAALEEENTRGKAITKTLVSSGTELQPRFIFIVQAYCQQALRSARVKPDWKHKPGSRPLVEPFQRASFF